MEKLPVVKMFTDGACSGNPGPGGWAALLVKDGARKTLHGAEGHTTNNRMEMTAVLMGLRALKAPCAVTIFSDSQYVVKGMTEWLAGWVRKGWKNSQGKAVENRDLWEELMEAVKPHKVRWEWVKGHDGHPENELVDGLAVAAIAEWRKSKK
ncbi:MAG: ribonuclease HI [Proteobacteria bacterium]|nr:ribonuclease HI [Pseudomonadota bacterium]NBX86804.1 ribonuclease HI [Pseudomonadota bacterium]